MADAGVGLSGGEALLGGGRGQALTSAAEISCPGSSDPRPVGLAEQFHVCLCLIFLPSPFFYEIDLSK